MLNIVIPMAGAGSRFANAGYKDPKPLIQVHQTPMIKGIINNLRPSRQHRFIFICQTEHVKKYSLVDRLKEWAPGSVIVEINGITEGAACTVLQAKPFIDNDDELMIANSDQYVDYDINTYLEKISNQNLDGLIMTMTANDPKWSFVDFSNDGFISRVVEKEVISDEATVGIYNFTRGSDFVKAAESMIESNERVNGEFYVAPVYNQLIMKGKRIGHENIGSEHAGMYGLGIPGDLDKFLQLPLSKQF